MCSMNNHWYEVWADEGLEVPYLLIVMPDGNGNGVQVLDPRENGCVVHRAGSYDAVRDWLLEDEYCRVIGTMRPPERL